MDVATRRAKWLGEIVDLMREPCSTLPMAILLPQLREAFSASMAGWHWFEADGSFGMSMDPPEVPLNEPETLEQWVTGELFNHHALLHWFDFTGDLRPQTTARVPTEILSRRLRLPLEQALAGMEMEHQLSIVYRHSGSMQRAFIVAQGRRDFGDDDLAVAEVVQRSVMALDHQVTVVQRMQGARTGADLGLTGRELAVLQLIAEGATTRRVSRTLACSPRTVEKHLENAYRRLDVRDRLNAVRVLRTAGVLGAQAVPDHRAVTGPGTYRGRMLRGTGHPQALGEPLLHSNEN